MHVTIFRCFKCGKEDAFQHKTQRYFTIEQRFAYFCTKCQEVTDHIAIKQHLDASLLD